MITPKDLRVEKDLRVKAQIQSALEEYSRLVVNQNPDANGCYEVSLGSLPFFTREEKEAIRLGIESALTEAGWEFEKTQNSF